MTALDDVVAALLAERYDHRWWKAPEKTAIEYDAAHKRGERLRAAEAGEAGEAEVVALREVAS